MGNNSPQGKCGCGGGLMTKAFWRSPPNKNNNNANNFEKISNSPGTKKVQGGCEDVAFLGRASSNNKKATTNSSPCSASKPIPVANQRNRPQASPTEGYVNNGRRVPKEAVGISGELKSMIADRQKGSGAFVRASSSNVMMYSNLGKLRQGGNTNTYSQGSKEQPDSLCRAVSTRMDPEKLKIMGNEDYKNGRFQQPLVLYDAAIAIDPNKASYRSNKSAALTALGRLLEAVFQCRKAIQIEPHYQRAHYRLGNLNMRLGETDRALYHYKQAGPEADPDEIAKVKQLQVHLNNCTEARRLGDWNKLIKETNNAISSGADSAPQIFALKAEALLKLRRHQHAEEVMLKGPNFDVDQCTKFFGPICNASIFVTQARGYLASGRFEDALVAIQRASKLDPNNDDMKKVMRKVRAVAAARSNGNELFKASKFSEACVAYGEGLENDPYNSLKRWEASIQDYEILLKETPEDEELRRALLESKEHLIQQRGE